MERFAWRMWQGEAGWPGKLARLALLPLEGAWRLATRARNRRYDRTGGVRVEGLDVISVGNLAVGGTGKTPVSAWVVEALDGFSGEPALLLRGYGDDEVRLHRHWSPAVPVMVGADRVAAARRAREAGAAIAVLDDGFQHRRLARSLDVVLLAAGDPVPGAVLPRGPYREPFGALRRADVMVVTRRTEPAEAARAVAEDLRAAGYLTSGAITAGVRLVATDVVPLGAYGSASAGRSTSAEGPTSADGSAPPPPEAASSPAPRVPADDANDEAAPDRALVATAIARSDAFFRDVEALTGATCQLLAFSDHHDFTVADARSIREEAGERPVYVTEKDAIKLAEHATLLGDVRVVRQGLSWDWGEAEVRRRLEALVHRATERTP